MQGATIQATSAKTGGVVKAKRNRPPAMPAGPDGRALRALVARSLAASGVGVDRADRAGGSGEDEGADVGPLPSEVPPRIEAPGPRRTPAFVDVSSRLVALLKRDYGRGVATDDGRRLGDLPEVAAWLEGLVPGRFRPREQAP